MASEICNNGLSLESTGTSGGKPYKLLAWNGKIIPGQTSIDYGTLNKWGVRYVTVIFEVYEAGKTKLLDIKRCWDCRYQKGTPIVCELTGKRINDSNIIPTWCPLKDA